jgi:hypothetical protein
MLLSVIFSSQSVKLFKHFSEDLIATHREELAEYTVLNNVESILQSNGLTCSKLSLPVTAFTAPVTHISIATGIQTYK